MFSCALSLSSTAALVFALSLCPCSLPLQSRLTSEVSQADCSLSVSLPPLAPSPPPLPVTRRVRPSLSKPQTLVGCLQWGLCSKPYVMTECSADSEFFFSPGNHGSEVSLPPPSPPCCFLLCSPPVLTCHLRLDSDSQHMCPFAPRPLQEPLLSFISPDLTNDFRVPCLISPPPRTSHSFKPPVNFLAAPKDWTTFFLLFFFFLLFGLSPDLLAALDCLIYSL